MAPRLATQQAKDLSSKSTTTWDAFPCERSAGRWLEILWHCLIRGQFYDEATHIANRNRALGKAG